MQLRSLVLVSFGELLLVPILMLSAYPLSRSSEEDDLLATTRRSSSSRSSVNELLDELRDDFSRHSHSQSAKQSQLLRRPNSDSDFSPDPTTQTDDDVPITSHQRHSSAPNKILHQRRHSRRLKDVTNYLVQYGYLTDTKVNPGTVAHALREFQELAGLKPTGSLNKETLRKMHRPRCGNSDTSAIGGERLDRRRRHRLKRFAQVSKWSQKLDSDDTLHLKWFIEHYTKDIPKDQIRDIVSRAFKLWSDQVSIPSMRTIKLDFQEAKDSAGADINIVWAERQHGDDYPFDGPGTSTNILAHTFYPNYQETGTLNGDIHFDDYEHWVLDNTTDPKGVHFPYVLVHEIGHALGLGHSKRQEAVMNPIYKQQALDTVVLDLDDKCAVNWNYIGPSNTCLFVWLMVELLPRAKETNATNHGIGSSVHAAEGELIRRNLLADPSSSNPNAVDREQELSQTLQGLKNKIPTCTGENDVQEQYEYMLETRWELSTTSAQAYGPVICNFFVGLNSYVDQLHNNDQRHPHRSSSASPSQLPDDEGSNAVREKRYSLEETSSLLDNTVNNNQEDASPKTIFDPEYFDLRFFQKLVKLMSNS